MARECFGTPLAGLRRCLTKVFHITREQLISKAINDVKLEVE